MKTLSMHVLEILLLERFGNVHTAITRIIQTDMKAAVLQAGPDVRDHGRHQEVKEDHQEVKEVLDPGRVILNRRDSKVAKENATYGDRIIKCQINDGARAERNDQSTQMDPDKRKG